MSFRNHNSSVASFGTRELRIINEKKWEKYRNLESSGDAEAENRKLVLSRTMQFQTIQYTVY